jgi:hypothetical protein
MNSRPIEKAAALARERHDGQLRKGPKQLPYVTHCEEVARLVLDHGGGEAAVAAAWLHDTLEDTDTTLDEIEALFGEEVAGIVNEVTDDPRLDKAAARAAQITEAPNKSTDAALVKAADQTSNMLSMVETPPYWSKEKGTGLRGEGPFRRLRTEHTGFTEGGFRTSSGRRRGRGARVHTRERMLSASKSGPSLGSARKHSLKIAN